MAKRFCDIQEICEPLAKAEARLAAEKKAAVRMTKFCDPCGPYNDAVARIAALEAQLKRCLELLAPDDELQALLRKLGRI